MHWPPNTITVRGSMLPAAPVRMRAQQLKLRSEISIDGRTEKSSLRVRPD